MIRRPAVLAALLTACASSQSEPLPEAPVPSAPLSAFAATRMIVLPVQNLRTDTLGWSTRVGPARTFLTAVDSALEAAFRDRGLGPTWAMPSDLERTARRNPDHAASPSIVRAGDAVRVMERRRGSEIPEPAGTQLRMLAGFHDARHAIVPVDLRFERAASGQGAHAVLRVAVLDVRASRLVWMGDIPGGEATEYSPAVVTDLANRFADLVVAR